MQRNNRTAHKAYGTVVEKMLHRWHAQMNLTDHLDSIHTRLDLKSAQESLTDKLRDGKQVGRCDLHGLIDCELNGDRYRILLEELWSLVIGCERYSRDEQAEKIMDGLIERYLDSHQELIEEEAIELAHQQDS